MGETEEEKSAQAGQLFENFVQASTCKGTLQAFNILCRQLDLDPLDHKSFYSRLKARVTFWKAKALWSKLDKRAAHKEYKKGKACTGTKCLIIGGGPCGLRTAIELALLGAKVVVMEKRDAFSRNNVLHLWPYTIHDLRGLGAKKFYGRFCAGAIDHISIRQLQLMLLKIALLVAVEVHVNVEFVKLLEPPEDQENEGPGWRAEVRPADHPVSDFDFDVVVGADGRRNTLEGFRRKEFRGKLAIAITANFINRNTTAEAKVEEISGVAFIFNQKFFLELKEETGVDLENIVYYKDNTHYFVMTAKKQSLLDKGVIIHDYIDTEMLLSSENVNQEALQSYAREAADFGTNYQLPSLDFAINHCGQPDVAMFDFTCMYASENAALVRERFGHQLLVALVGDSLLEPFWPMGTGCARGFLAAFDTAWMVRSWAQGRTPLEILAERESIYRLLPQTTPENITKNFEQYTVDPVTRYPNLNSSCVRPHQVKHLYITGELQPCSLERASSVRRPVNLSRRESEVRPSRLLTWCQKQTEGYRNVSVCDLASSWKSGLALCALVHRFRADLIDFDSLNEEDAAANNQLAFDAAEREFGIPPVTTGNEMAAAGEPDKLGMVVYLSRFYELFRGAPLPAAGSKGETDENNEDYSSKSDNSVYNLMNLTLPRKRIPKDDKKLEDSDSANKRRRKGCNYLEEATNFSSQSAPSGGDGGEQKENKVRSMATQLLAKFEENAAPTCTIRRQGSVRREFPQTLGGSDTCHFCGRRVYVMERLSAEGRFFHRECFRCHACSATLRLGGHAFDSEQGKFYCKLHFAQRKTSIRYKRRTVDPQKEAQGAITTDSSRTSSPDGGGGGGACSAAGSLRSQPPGGYFQHLSNQTSPEMCGGPAQTGRLDPSVVAELPEESGSAPAAEGPAPSDARQASDTPGCEGSEVTSLLSLDARLAEEAGALPGEGAAPTGPAQLERNGRWRRKIQATFPLILVKTHNRTTSTTGLGDQPRDCRGEEEEESDFEEIFLPAPESPVGSGRPLHQEPRAEGADFLPGDSAPCLPPSSSHEDPPAAQLGRRGQPASEYLAVEKTKTGKKKLTLSQTQKEKLLEWDLGGPDQGPREGRAEAGARREEGSGTDRKAEVEVPADPPLLPPRPPPTPSPLQLVVNALRRSFRISGTAAPKAVARSNGAARARPRSEGSFSLNSLFGAAGRPDLAPPSAPTATGGGTSGAGENTSATPTSATATSNSASATPTSATPTSTSALATSTSASATPASVTPTSTSATPTSASTSTCASACASSPPGSSGSTAGADLPGILQRVSLGPGAPRDDLAALPPRKLNFFSSMRVKRCEGAERAGREGRSSQDKDIWTIISDLRNKVSNPQQQDSSSSSEEESGVGKQRGTSGPRKRRKQEEVVKQQARRDQLKRLHRAQVIQRQLEEVEEKQRALEERGVALEKLLRGETEDRSQDEAQLLQTWFRLVLEKNKLARYESELVIFAQELELEDTQSQLQQKLRRRMAVDSSRKSAWEQAEEQQIFSEMMRVVEKRDALVSLLEEQRLKERAEDQDLESLVLTKGYRLHWA
ncbi:protein-methionine sulfoxide oxidase mical2b isoform X2 [Anguilla anguilla]|uniref:protein-methionine sulfoxide oxidase mical2b isoform X2 n=1 Tax=Anguilla anguilla TaxID=7936 RepID=UPI0015AE7B59|nr:protein-methionine sulfoxide oxidase mical2b isoform X2 [Anguilla anguilla]